MSPPKCYLYQIALLMIVLNTDRLLHLRQHADPKTTSLFVLDIAVLSARQNFDKRQAIRDTWLQEVFLANQLSSQYDWPFRINVQFVLGNSPCLVHPLNREDLYDCVPKLNHPQNKSKLNVLFDLNTKPSSSRYEHRLVHNGFSFKVCSVFYCLTATNFQVADILTNFIAESWCTVFVT